MFFGEYSHLLDEKGRLRIPAKLKPKLGSQFVVTKGTNGCLFVFAKKFFEEEFLNKLNSVPTFNSEGQKPIRMLLSSTFEAEEDGQGRFLLPASLKDFARIEKNVQFVGVGNRIEIWSQVNWETYLKQDGEFDQVVSALKNYDI